MSVGLESIECGVAWLRWERSEAANAFDENLIEVLLEQLYKLEADPPTVLALAGRGGRFCAGFDLTGPLVDNDLAHRFERAEELLAVVRRFPAASVACVEGPAFGLGADLVAACDYRLGDSRAQFRFPGPRFGIVLGTHQLRERVGRSRATDVLLRNAVVAADQALADGLLTHQLEATDQAEFVEQLAHDMAGLPPDAARELLRILRPDVAEASAAALRHSAYRPGLAARIEDYRTAALASRGGGR